MKLSIYYPIFVIHYYEVNGKYFYLKNVLQILTFCKLSAGYRQLLINKTKYNWEFKKNLLICSEKKSKKTISIYANDKTSHHCFIMNQDYWLIIPRTGARFWFPFRKSTKWSFATEIMRSEAFFSHKVKTSPIGSKNSTHRSSTFETYLILVEKIS